MARSYQVSAAGTPRAFVSVCAAARDASHNFHHTFHHNTAIYPRGDLKYYAGVSRPRTRVWLPYYPTRNARYRLPLQKAAPDSTEVGRRFRPNSLNKRKFSPIY